MPSTATCTGGSAVTRRPLPSLVTSTIEPVSATAMLAPVMPTSAARNTSRSRPRAKPTSSVGLGAERGFGADRVDEQVVDLVAVAGAAPGR